MTHLIRDSMALYNVLETLLDSASEYRLVSMNIQPLVS